MRGSWFLPACVVAVLAACAPEPDAPGEAPEPDVPGDAQASKASAHEGHRMPEVSEREARDKKEAAEMLVARFDAEECQRIDLIGRVRRTDADGGRRVLHAYGASAACAKELTATVTALGFDETGPGLFAGGPFDGAMERVLIEIADDGSGAMIEWEVDTP
ncbi:MAG: hypothetical protein QNI87_03135 [Erythrobacter sp.]|uniref:hypothetical protein n=1 Tax=Erythrobacter sp. TaxID=1042 RepID=UPI002621A256|nr:hypothetical protein [Erythrobacter sp.]MDJ0977505.1 hypothetical protein [Erythrobacter sp.]